MPNNPADLVSGVTADNYAQLGSAFIGANGNGFLIALENGEQQGVTYQQTLKQWGAWYAFFFKIIHRAWLMRTRLFYTVPAEWPHEFTTDATVQDDHRIGSEFERRWLNARDRERNYGSSAQRLATVAAFRAQIPHEKRKPKSPAEHLVAPEIDPPWTVDREALFRSHDEAVAK